MVNAQLNINTFIMKSFIKDCNYCLGTGKDGRNRTWDNNPCWDETWPCEDCHGEGTIIDNEELEYLIMDVEDMIEGMMIRIKTTSDTLKDLSRGMFYELLPKYKHRLQIQSSALARLELYLANLKTY